MPVPPGPTRAQAYCPGRPETCRVLDGEDQPDDRGDSAGHRETRAFPAGRDEAPGEQEDARNDHEQRPTVASEIDPGDPVDEEQATERDQDDPEDHTSAAVRRPLAGHRSGSRPRRVIVSRGPARPA